MAGRKTKWFDTRHSKFTTRQPTKAQLDSLYKFVIEQGPDWRTVLHDCWVRGVWPLYGYTYDQQTAHLQQIRNQFGPKWLETFVPEIGTYGWSDAAMKKHRRRDPHCTCNDCIEAHMEKLESTK